VIREKGTQPAFVRGTGHQKNVASIRKQWTKPAERNVEIRKFMKANIINTNKRRIK